MTLLRIADLDVHHGLLRAVTGFSITVEKGEVVSVIGANGAGKSTLMRAVAGSIPVSAGRIEVSGLDVTHLRAHQRLMSGVALVPEGRRLFRSLTLEDNLLAGAYRKRPGPWSLDKVYDLFDWMLDRRNQKSRLL